MAKRSAPASKKPSNIDRFIALPDAEKERIFESYNREIPFSETRPLTPAQRARWERAQKRERAEKQTVSQAKVGKGTETIRVDIDRELLEQADAYAKTHGLKRTQLVAAGLRLAMANGVTADTLAAAGVGG